MKTLQLNWSDEFDGTDFNENWILADSPRRGGFWRPEAVAVDDGVLQIKTYLMKRPVLISMVAPLQ